MRRLATVLLGALLASGCGGGDGDRSDFPGDGALTIYSSLPMHGASARASNAVVAGQRLALEDHKGHAGGRKVLLRALDSSKPDGDTWDPGLVEKNAKRATADPSTVAYLGELDHGGSAISVPVTNAKGILQIAPLDGLTSLTREQPGGPRGGPERYYPSKVRTFARLVPVDLMQATTLVDWARERGAHSVAIVHDNRLYGRAMAAQAVFVADARKLPVVTVIEVSSGGKPSDPTEQGRKLAEQKQPADAVLFAGLPDSNVAPLLAAIEQAVPAAELYVAGLPPEQQLPGVGSARLVADVRPANEYGPKAIRLLQRLGPRTPVEALYGYESMRLALQAIDRAGPNRAAVVREAVRPGGRAGALGEIRLVRGGDVADQRVAIYRPNGATLAFEGLRAAQPPELRAR